MKRYRSMEDGRKVDRREFARTVGTCSVVLGGMVLGWPARAQEAQHGDATPTPTPAPPPRPETNIEEFLKVPRGPHAIPGPFPGKVVKVVNAGCLKDDQIQATVVNDMLEAGIVRLTDRDLKKSFELFFTRDDVVGLKVNPVGPPLINTRHELVEGVVRWLVDSGLPKKNIIIWDRFEGMLVEAGYTAERYPGVGLEGMGMMAEEGESFRDEKGAHLSAGNFDLDAYLYAKGVEGKGVRGYKNDEFYLNQHVFNGEYSYFGTLVTKKLTKIINLPVLKNTGGGISVATKNLGYGVICNCGRLHSRLFFDVNTEVLAAPWVRDKLVLNITDGIRAQYDDGPGLNAQFVYPAGTLYFATDPFASDMVCHQDLVAKRREMGLKVDEHPRYTEYLRYGERLGLGIADPAKITLVQVPA